MTTPKQYDDSGWRLLITSLLFTLISDVASLAARPYKAAAFGLCGLGIAMLSAVYFYVGSKR